MNNFKNNHRRSRFKLNGDRNFRKRNGNGQKINGDFNNNLDFKRRNPGRNNQNASKLVDKYNDLAREALSKGDKILSENYFQHADHFSRILSERQDHKILKDKDSITHNDKTTSENKELDPKEERGEIHQKEILKS